jgi:hypothetical protein
MAISVCRGTLKQGSDDAHAWKEAMPENETKSARAAPISYRPPKDREAELLARVAASGLPVNAFITQAIFGRNRHRPDELQALAGLLARTAQISDRLSEIELAGAGGSAPPIEAAQRDLADIRAALIALMGRAP